MMAYDFTLWLVGKSFAEWHWKDEDIYTGWAAIDVMFINI